MESGAALGWEQCWGLPILLRTLLMPEQPYRPSPISSPLRSSHNMPLASSDPQHPAEGPPRDFTSPRRASRG